MWEFSINPESKTPKYKQIIDSVINGIEKKQLNLGDKVPSINAISETYLLSRDTVEKAYSYLKDKNFITSVKGKGHFIANTDLVSKIHVCLIFNKLSPYKKMIYDSIVRGLGDLAFVDLFIHHCDPEIFDNLVTKKLGEYSYYVVMPNFHVIDDRVKSTLKKIPDTELIILDRLIPELVGNFGSIYQDFRRDIFEALEANIDDIKRYQKINLVFPVDEVYPYPNEIIRGFNDFGSKYQIETQVIDQIIENYGVRKGELYIVIDEYDLINLIKTIREKGLKTGDDIGIISYNETPLKEVLENGITVMTTDFKAMGKSVANMIKSKKLIQEKNDFVFIERNSL
ncbi:MAG: GntR family transcriptional regulator [Cyclobacteriaceae bacterium]